MHNPARTITILTTAALAALLSPAAALACGGFFCSNNQPVNQAAERIVFAYDGEQVHMHIRITYEGPESEFGWILPVPASGNADDPGVDAQLSSERLFGTLDNLYGPRFQTRTIFNDEGCGFAQRSGSSGGVPVMDVAEEGDSVEVHARDAVGPYDRAILSADTVEVLRQWLADNEFDIPDVIDEKLAPYVSEGRVFVVLKLLPDSSTGDIVPLRVTFLSNAASVPIRPTAVAANPDMGVIVHVLDDKRAIPTNYRHVEINEAAIDWLGGGQNYPDVVSQAVDEAGGHAFTTDYAGATDALQGTLEPISEDIIEGARAAETTEQLRQLLSRTRSDADLTRVIQSEMAAQAEGAVDGIEVAARIDTEINEPRRQLAPFLERPYLTRLYTTLSPAEMTEDPAFDLNGDLGEVNNVRTAELHLDCDGDALKIVTESGLSFFMEAGANPNVVRREDGVTVEGDALPSAALIQTMLTSGEPEIVEDNRDEIREALETETGCLCAAVNSPWRSSALGLLPLLGRR